MSADAADNLVLARSRGRTIAFVVFAFVVASYFALSATLRPTGIWPLDALGVLLGVAFVYLGLVAAVQGARGVPLLVASAAGIWIDNPWGLMVVRWPDVAGFSTGNSRTLRIRLRDGAPPIGPIWTRILSASVRARHTVAVSLLTTVPRPDDVARALTEMQARYRS